MIIYPWYDLITDSDDITQGDIIKKCPVPILKGMPKQEETVDAEVELIDGIILTQACDIENKKVENIILCSVTSRKDFGEQLLSAGKKPKEITNYINGIVKGQQHAYHIINNYVSDGYSDDYYIICFKDIFSVPVSLVKKIAKENGKRLRLCPPYREHLSQAFARYFMRVGLPINISLQ